MFCGQNWQPTLVKRVIERLPTSTWPIYIDTDEGQGYMKCKGGPSGNGVLFSEVLCGELALLLDLPLPHFAIIRVSNEDQLIFVNNQPVEEGNSFISKRIEGSACWSEHYMKRLINKEVISRLVIFDSWVKNIDRFPPEGSIHSSNNENLLVVKQKGYYTLMLIDHSHCLDDQDVIDVLPDEDWVIDEDVYGMTPSFELYLEKNKELLRADCERLGLVSKSKIDEILNSIPRDWGLTESARIKWSNLLYQRAQFLSRELPSLIFEQKELRI